MESKIIEKIFFVDRANIDTDQIIPAKYLTGVSMTGLGEYLFEDLDLPGFDRKDPKFLEAGILISRENFGCGSSREHAVWALEGNGFKAVIAPSFARIFRQNMFNRGLLAIELPEEVIEEIRQSSWQYCGIDLEEMTLFFWTPEKKSEKYSFSLAEFDKELVTKGGLVGYIDGKY